MNEIYGHKPIVPCENFTHMVTRGCPFLMVAHVIISADSARMTAQLTSITPTPPLLACMHHHHAGTRPRIEEKTSKRCMNFATRTHFLLSLAPYF
jgi:hypothetical protein